MNPQGNTPIPTIRPLTPADTEWVRTQMINEWGAETVVVRGSVFRPVELPGFAIHHKDVPAGLITYRVDGEICEIMTLNTWGAGAGMAGALIREVRKAAILKGCRCLRVVTTNDNTGALRFYQRHGFNFCAVRLNIMEESRRIKPQIPPTGEDGIPIRDEIELEMKL